MNRNKVCGMTRQEMNATVQAHKRQAATPRGEQVQTVEQAIRACIRRNWALPICWADEKGSHEAWGMQVLKGWERDKVARILLGIKEAV